MRVLLLITLLTVSISSFCQKIGIKAGVLVSKVEKTSAMFGGSAGVFLQTKGKVYFLAEANFKSINGSITVPVVNNINTKTGEAKKVYSYFFVEMPLLLGLMGDYKNEKGSFRPFVNIGASPAIVIGSKYDKKSYTTPEDFNLSFVVSPGVMMSDKVSIEARLNKSLIGLNYTSFTFLLGVRF